MILLPFSPHVVIFSVALGATFIVDPARPRSDYAPFLSYKLLAYLYLLLLFNMSLFRISEYLLDITLRRICVWTSSLLLFKLLRSISR